MGVALCVDPDSIVFLDFELFEQDDRISQD
jgi:hypothetical protein